VQIFLQVETVTAKEAREESFCRGKLLGCPLSRGSPGIKVRTKWQSSHGHGNVPNTPLKGNRRTGNSRWGWGKTYWT